MITALALLSNAYAVAPTNLDGREPVRVYRDTDAAQARFARSERWRAFQAAEGTGWQALLDERTGVPRRLWGHTQLGKLADQDALDAALQGFIGRHAVLLGAVHPLQLRSTSTDPDFGITYVDYDVLIEGRPVWRGGMTFRVRDANLVLVGAATYPHTPRRGAFTLSRAAAIQAAIRATPAPRAQHTTTSVREVWLPIERDGLVLQAAYEVTTTTRDPVGRWVTHVTADTGEALASYNEVRHLSGVIEAEHDVRSPGSGVATSPVAGSFVSTSFDTVTTDADGSYSLDGEQATTVLQGDQVVLTDHAGDAILDVEPSGHALWSADGAARAALDTWVFTQQVRSTWNEVVPSLDWTDGRADAFVNLDDACNAYYDGTLNFFAAGAGCANTGRLADVVYHEWGHGLHYESLRAGSFDGTLSEGVGDVVAFLMTTDPRLAPGFFDNGDYLRNAENDLSYPDDIQGEVHHDGMIFSGSMWNTYRALVASHGEQQGLERTRYILAGLLQGGPGLDGAMTEALLADDDDANLSNGTPNECVIVQGFAAHGLAFGTGGFAAGHAPFVSTPDQEPIPIAANLIGPQRCLEDAGAAPIVTWRVDDGSWQETVLVADGSDIAGSLPAQPEGSFVEYYIEVPTSVGVIEAPKGGWRNPYVVYVGDAVPIHCDDFEADNGGYTHELVAGEPGDGADDWQYGRPQGRSGDPIAAHSGEKVWGNDLGRRDFDGAYQDDKHNRLTSPRIDLGHYEGAFLQYWRWLRVEDATFDQATIQVNGATVWTNVVGEGQDHHLENQWVSHAVELQPGLTEATVSFDLQSDGGLTMGGWTIDDVCFMAPATPNNRLGVHDFVASEGQEGGVELSWTNPPHAPLAEVRVVRKRGGCPTHAEDGDVVFFDNSPVLGARQDVFDPTPSRRSFCYGVFPGDGDTLLGFAVAGWNVDEGKAGSRASRSEVDDAFADNGLDDFEATYGSPKHGGCSTVVSLPWSGALLLGLVGLIRRR